jgi:hypothetical protein
MKIVLLGNHGVPYSTESHHAWTWEKLGHQVVRLQEGKATTEDVVDACKGAAAFQWTHTHGWAMPGHIVPEEMLSRVHASGTKSFAYHLDVYFGLDAWDKRDSKVGIHPSWKVQHFFSTVGSKDDKFATRGVNHHWLPPAVVEYGCYEGRPTPGLIADVGFAGSVNYHPEYPFRAKMVQALQARYGSRFRVFTGYREKLLNDLYASVKVMVGDHCFAGEPKYWSDRLPETCGRGGFIVYPRTEGMTIPTATYEPQNIDDLFSAIDNYLEDVHAREEIRHKAFEHVKQYDTYTQRLQEVLRVMGLG